MLKDPLSSRMVDLSPQLDTSSVLGGYGKSKASPKTPRSPKRSHKGSGGRSLKASKTSSKKSASKKSSSSQHHRQQSASPALKQSKQTSSSHQTTVDSDTDQHDFGLLMLSTTQPSDEERVVSNPASSPEGSNNLMTGNLTSFPRTMGAGSDQGYGKLSVEASSGSGGTSNPQWLLSAHAEDSDSNISE